MGRMGLWDLCDIVSPCLTMFDRDRKAQLGQISIQSHAPRQNIVAVSTCDGKQVIFDTGSGNLILPTTACRSEGCPAKWIRAVRSATVLQEQ